MVLAKRAREQSRPHLYSGGMLVASGVMYLRLLALLRIFNRQLFHRLGLPFLLFAAAVLLGGLRIVFRCLELGTVALLIAATPISAQKIKVKSDYDKSNDFARYKRYAMGKNFLLTHQTPEVEAQIDQVLVESLNRHLQAKGFILDEDHPDFIVSYEAGSLPKADTSAQPGMYYRVPSDSPAFGPVGLEGISAAVWTCALAKLKLTVTDVGSRKPVWTARASEKIQDPQKALHDLKKKVDDLMARTLKSFPPASGTK